MTSGNWQLAKEIDELDKLSDADLARQRVVARGLGSREAAMRFRHLIAEAAGPADGGTEFFSRVWDALYDGVSAGEINTPEELGPVLRSVLGLDPVAP